MIRTEEPNLGSGPKNRIQDPDRGTGFRNRKKDPNLKFEFSQKNASLVESICHSILLVDTRGVVLWVLRFLSFVLLTFSRGPCCVTFCGKHMSSSSAALEATPRDRRCWPSSRKALSVFLVCCGSNTICATIDCLIRDFIIIGQINESIWFR